MPEPDFLKDYVDVAERITEFRTKHPDGSFQVSVIELPEAWRDSFIAVEARAYRSPDDDRPGVDVAWEPVPGKTSYTKDSELMNASTSAVGRAIVWALAADTKRGIASRQEVMNRRNGEEEQPTLQSSPEPPSPAQKSKITQLLNKSVAMAHHADLKAQATSKADATQLISRLIKVDAGEADVPKLLAAYNITPESDVPWSDE